MNTKTLGLLLLCSVLSACSSDDHQALGFDSQAEMARAHQMGYHTKARMVEMTTLGVAANTASTGSM